MSWLRAFIVVSLILGISFLGVSQARKGYKISKNNKSRAEAWPNPYDFYPGGWLFDAGLTNTFGFGAQTVLTDTNSTTQSSPQYRPGITLMAGRYFSLKKFHKVIKYVDVTLGYKSLWMEESNTHTTSGVAQTQSNSVFIHQVSANFNLNNIWSFNSYVFLQNILGLNADYGFAFSEGARNTPLVKNPANFIVQAHYKIGLGLMVRPNLCVLPYVEIPVYNLTPSQTNFSQIDYGFSSFQTAIVGVRVVLFTLGQKDCPKAINTDGKARNNGY